jgi:NTP pyrophosphatase (non-canonical NTP hydrolase)
MQDTKYVDEAHRTLILGIQDGTQVSAENLRLILRKINDVTETADALKKSVIYGKPNPALRGAETKVDATAYLSAVDADIFHAALGIFTEAGEIMQAVQKSLETGEPIDLVNLKEEAGDAFWYLAILSRAADFTFGQAKKANIEKLMKRYPEKYSQEQALERDLDAEREALETD